MLISISEVEAYVRNKALWLWISGYKSYIKGIVNINVKGSVNVLTLISILQIRLVMLS